MAYVLLKSAYPCCVHVTLTVCMCAGEGEALVDCKASRTTTTMPEDSAVAHGDANLALEDFMKSASLRLAA